MADVTGWATLFSSEARLLNRRFSKHAACTVTRRLMCRVPHRLFLNALECLYVPGMAHHYLFRKLLIEQTVIRGLVDDHAGQVVVVGAGFDTLCVRLARTYPAVSFFEVDLDQTQRTKTDILIRSGHSVPRNCSFVAGDLTVASLRSVLRGDFRFRPEVLTWIVIEGVLMYLSQGDVQALFNHLNSAFSGPFKVIFGAIAAPDDGGSRRRRFVNWVLSQKGEQVKWHCSSREMPRFINRVGCRLTAWLPYRRLQEVYRSPGDLGGIPEEDENFYIVEGGGIPDVQGGTCDIDQIPFIRTGEPDR